MTENQATNNLLTPDDVRASVAYLQAHRARSGRFDIAVNGQTPADSSHAAELVQLYREAGATWWVEGSRKTVEENRERIRKGPPKV